MQKITFVFFIFLLFGCSKQNEKAQLEINGYIEGEYRYISSPESGWITELNVNEGKNIIEGDLLVQLDNETEQIAFEQQKFKRNTAQAQLDDLLKGARKEELEILKKQRQEINAELKLAKITLKRYKELKNSNAIATADLDTATAKVNSLMAKIESIDAELQSQALPARSDEINAAKAILQTEEMALMQSENQRSKRSIKSDLNGQVTNIYYRKGEFVTIGEPILQVLPKDARKIIFYLPTKILSQIKLGEVITAKTNEIDEFDGVISKINDTAEYIPPMLYTTTVEDTLVFRVEAKINIGFHSPSVGVPITIIFKSKDG